MVTKWCRKYRNSLSDHVASVISTGGQFQSSYEIHFKTGQRVSLSICNFSNQSRPHSCKKKWAIKEPLCHELNTRLVIKRWITNWSKMYVKWSQVGCLNVKLPPLCVTLYVAT